MLTVSHVSLVSIFQPWC